MSKDLKDLSKILNFEKIFEFELNEVFTWGNNDKEKRENNSSVCLLRNSERTFYRRLCMGL